MGIFSTVEREKRAAELTLEGSQSFAEVFTSGPTASGVSVTEGKARTYSAYWNAVYLLSSYLGMISLKLFKRRDDGGKEEERDHPLFDTLHMKPNEEMSATAYRESIQGHILNQGDGYSLVVRNGRGQVAELWPLNPRNTELFRKKGGRRWYRTVIGNSPTEFPADRVFHVPGLGFDGRSGYSILSLAKETVGGGLAMEEFRHRFFQNAATPKGVLNVPEAMSDGAKKRLKTQWNQAHTGLNQAQKTAVLEGAVEWQNIGISSDDAQLLESEEFTAEQVIRYFNIPPHKIGLLENANFATVAEEQISFLQDTLQPWLTRWEQAINTQLLTKRERSRGLFAEFNVDTILRSDPEQRSEMFNTRFNTGSITPNQIRELENENPLDVEGADVPYVQSNQIPLDMAQDLGPGARAMIQASESGDPEAIKATARAYLEEVRSNGGTPTEDRQPEDEDGAVQERQRLANVFLSLFVRDAGRMVRAEVQDIRSEMGQVLAEDGVDGLMEFLFDFYRAGDEGEIEGIARRTVKPTMDAYAEAVADAVAQDQGIEASEELVRGFVDGDDGYFATFVDRHAASSRKQLQGVARDTQDADTAPDEALEQRLTEWEEGRREGEQPSRAEKMADEETHKLGNAMAQATFATAGVTVLRWLAVGDSCPFCNMLNGQVVGIEEKFVNSGDSLSPEDADTPLEPARDIGHPPIHGGCDCLVVPG